MTGLEIFSAVFMVLTAGILILGWFGTAQDILKAIQSYRWIKTEGQVLSSRIDRDEFDGSVSFKATLDYEYRVDTQCFRSSTIGYFGMHALTMGNAKKQLGGMSVGDSIDVYYNPENPMEAVILRGLHPGHIGSLIFVVCLFLIAAFLVSLI